MFPRAARFKATRGNDVPGPNAYDPTEQEAHYKRGAMFERDARFRAASRLSDHGVAAENDQGGVATTSKVKLDGRILSLEKEKARLEARVKASEERLEASTAMCTALQNDKKQLHADLRLMAQKQERLQGQSASQSKGQAMRQDAVQQLRQRTQVLESERATQKAQIERLNASYSRSEADKFAANEVIMGLRKKLKEALESNDVQAERIKGLQSSLTEERALREETQGANEDLRGVHDNLLKQVDQSEAEQRSQVDVLGRTNKLLAQELGEVEEEKEHWRMQRDALVRAGILLARDGQDLRTRLAEAGLDVRIGEMQIRRLTVMVQQLQRSLANVADRDDDGLLEIERTERREEHLTNRFSVDVEETHETLSLAWLADHIESEAQVRALDEQRTEIMRSHELELSELNERVIDRLQGDLKSANAQLRAYLLERQSQTELRQELEAVRDNLGTVEDAYEAGVLDVMQSHEQIEQLQGQLNRTKAEHAAMSQRVQALDRTQIDLRNAKLRESALMAERQELLEDLARSSNYEAAYFGIRAEAHKLLSRLTAREVQAQELTSLNAALASNSNPHQKINYLERIRTQLDDARLLCREMEQERNALHRQCRDLQAQLDTFTQVENGGGVLARHQAAANAGGAPLDEREAARRAWQSRPKTRYTRIGRQASHTDDGDAADATSGDTLLRVAVQTRPRLRERPSRGALSDRSTNELARSLDSSRVTVQDESGEVTMLMSDVTMRSTANEEDGLEAPKRRALRARKSDTALRDRSSPVATLPSFDALAWDLDKDHLTPPMFTPYVEELSSSPNNRIPNRIINVLDGELSLADLTGS